MMLRVMFRVVLPVVMMFVALDALGGGGRHEQRRTHEGQHGEEEQRFFHDSDFSPAGLIWSDNSAVDYVARLTRRKKSYKNCDRQNPPAYRHRPARPGQK